MSTNPYKHGMKRAVPLLKSDENLDAFFYSMSRDRLVLAKSGTFVVLAGFTGPVRFGVFHVAILLGRGSHPTLGMPPLTSLIDPPNPQPKITPATPK